MNNLEQTHETLLADITLNYGRYKHEPQERNEHGKLTSVLADIFENRMNTALDEYSKLVKFSGSAVMLNETAKV